MKLFNTLLFISVLLIFGSAFAQESPDDYIGDAKGLGDVGIEGIEELENQYGTVSAVRIQTEVDNDPELEQCKRAAEDSKSKCNIVSPEMMMMLGGASQIGGAAMSGNSIKDKCDAAAKISSLGAAANTSLGGLCLMQANACADYCGQRERKTATEKEAYAKEVKVACQASLNKRKELRSKRVTARERDEYIALAGRCKGEQEQLAIATNLNRGFQRGAGACMDYKTKSYPMLIQAVANAGIAAASASCASKAGESSIAAFCARAENAGSASCGGVANCSDPLRARQDPSCVCTNPTAMATNPICAGYGGSGTTAGVGGSALSGGGNSSLSSLSPDGLTNKDFKGVAVKPTESQNPGVPNGGGGGQMGAGSNPGSLNPEEGGGHAADYKTDLDQGYQRSRGGGEGGGSMFGGYRGSGGGSEYGSSGKSKSSFNLSKYLPWTQKGPAREIASRQLRSEGVTAAEGPSIWEKVTTRMRALKTNLQ